jgi:hypothetical protein
MPHLKIEKKPSAEFVCTSSEKHLQRYLAEFDFRYNHRIALGYNDNERTVLAVRAAEGKRLTYHQPN